MPIDEIVQEYRTAKDPGKMIDIMADMNDTNPSRIAWVLHRCGLTVPLKKMPRARRLEGEDDIEEYWENSHDAVVCDEIRRRFEELTEEREQKEREAEQSMPGFDEPVTVLEKIKPYPAGAVEPGKTGCMKEKETRKEEKSMDAKKAFEPECRIIERIEAAMEADKPKEEPADLRRNILMEAAVCVCTDRNVLYGEAEDNFAVIARMWSAYLGVSVSAWDVADMMILFKVARNATAERASRDTYVDIAGYAACGGGMIEAEK